MPEDNPKPAARRARVVTEVEDALDSKEEQVLRALHGSVVPDDFVLPQKDEGLPEALRAQLRAIEQAAFERAGRLQELSADLEQEEAEEAAREAARAKIVARLRAQASAAGDPET